LLLNVARCRRHRPRCERERIELWEKEIVEHTGPNQLRSSLERQAELARTLLELEEERRGYLRQNARGVASDAALDARREAVASEMSWVEEGAATLRSIQATRYSLLHE
jgi:hypothetical protein